MTISGLLVATVTIAISAGRQVDVERRALARLALDAQKTPVGFDDAHHGGQTQPGAFAQHPWS